MVFPRRFDGFLDVQLKVSPATWQVAALDAVAHLLLPSLLFWSASWLWGRQGRWSDFLASIGVARIVQLYLACVALSFMPATPDALRTNAVQAILGAVLALLGVAWFLSMLWYAFRYASGLRGKRLGIAFVCTLLLTEGLSLLLARGVLFS
ncbi:MAG: hypothetical protein AAGJ35_15965 [Myxococcota bacterium]